MSILKFLAAGKSLMGMKDHHSRYRLDSRNQLPKFGTSKNPFNPAENLPSNATPPSTVHGRKGAKDGTPELTAKPMVNLSLFDSELKPVATAATVEEPVSAPAAPEIPLAKADNGVTVEVRKTLVEEQFKTTASSEVSRQPMAASATKSVPSAKPVNRTHLSRDGSGSLFQGWMRKLNPLAYFSSREAEGNRPRGRSQVQGEFLLDHVKPIRNDLHDSDIELVAASQPVREVVAPQPVAVEVASSSDGTVGRITTRYFGEAKLQAK